MPSIERPAADPKLQEDAKESYRLRLEASIDQFEAKLREGCKGSKDVSAAEEQLVVETALERWRKELHELLHPAPKGEAPGTTEAMLGLGGLVQKLQQEIELLKTKLTGKDSDGAVSKPQAPPKA